MLTGPKTLDSVTITLKITNLNKNNSFHIIKSSTQDKSKRWFKVDV